MVVVLKYMVVVLKMVAVLMYGGCIDIWWLY